MGLMGRWAGDVWAGKGKGAGGLVHRHSSERKRRGSAWRRAVDGLCETRGLQRRHLLRCERVEIERKLGHRAAPASMRRERCARRGCEVRDVLLPGTDAGGSAGGGAGGWWARRRSTHIWI